MSSVDHGHVARAYRRWLPFVRRALTRLRVRPEDIDDVAQEVFVVMLRKLAPHGDDDNLRGWLYETARRVANNHRRGQGRHDRKVAVAQAMATRAAASRIDVGGPLLRLQRALASLDPEEQVAFRMAIVAGRTGREVATTLGVKPHVAYAMISRVRARLDDAIDHGRERRSKVAAVVGWLHRAVARVLPQGLQHALAVGTFAMVVMLAPAPAEPSVPVAPASPRPDAAAIASVDDDEGLLLIVDDDEPSETELEGDDGLIIIADEDDSRPALRTGARTPDDLEAALVAFAPASPTRDTNALEAALLAFEPAPDAGPPPVEPRAESASERGNRPRPADLGPRAVAGQRYWRGKMLRADGTALAHATVRCRRRTEWGGMRRCFDRDHAPPRTDDGGRVVVGPLTAGTYELVAFDNGSVASIYPTVVVRVR